MSRFNVVLVGLLALPGALFCMENKQLSLHKQPKNLMNKWIDSSKCYNQHSYSKKTQVVCVDGPDSLYRFSRLSINDARQSVQESPKEWIQFLQFSHGKGVDTLKPLLYCSDEQLHKFGNILGLDKQNTGKILTMPLSNVLEEINTLQAFQKNRTKKLSLNDLVKMSRDQIETVGQLDNHFKGNVVNIQVDRNQYDRIASLPKKVKSSFRNDEEFYTASLMRGTTDKIVHVGIETAKGVVIGSGAGAIVSLGTNCGIDKVLMPAAQEYAINMLKKHALFGVTNVLIGKAHQDGMQAAHKTYAKIISDDEISKSSLFVEVPKEYFKSAGETVINVESFKKEFKPEKFMPTAVEHLKNGGTPMNEKNIQEALAKSIKAAQTGAVIGGITGATYGLYTMNEPIVTKSISKI